jgi:hypothetical protein
MQLRRITNPVIAPLHAVPFLRYLVVSALPESTRLEYSRQPNHDKMNTVRNGATMKQIHGLVLAVWLLGSVSTVVAGPFNYEFQETAPGVWG